MATVWQLATAGPLQAHAETAGDLLLLLRLPLLLAKHIYARNKLGEAVQVSQQPPTSNALTQGLTGHPHPV